MTKPEPLSDEGLEHLPMIFGARYGRAYTLRVLATIDALETEVDRLKGRDPQCAEHGSGKGKRARCLVCAGIELEAALSAIDLACEGGNEMNVSGYDLHCDPSLVVKHVESKLAKLDKVQGLVEKWLQRAEEGGPHGGDPAEIAWMDAYTSLADELQAVLDD